MTVKGEISVLTPVGATHARYLSAAWTSIERQAVPRGWRVRWYVQEDGPESEVRSFVGSIDHDLAEYSASGASGGPAEARNLALARCTGEVVMMLDADDRLTDGAVERVVSSLSEGHMWCGFAADDDRCGIISRRAGGYSMRLGTDRMPPAGEPDFDPSVWEGHVARGRLRECWEEAGMLPFHPATFASHARWFWDAGGWPALARDEDTALILAISDRHDGVVSTEPNIVYRHHGHQTSRLIPPNDARITFIRRLAR